MNLHFSDVAKDETLESYPAAVKALSRYLKQNKTGICGKEGTYRFRVRIAKERNLSARRYEFGLKTSNLAEAVKRAGELVALFHFFGWIVASRQINAPALASLFPLSDLSDDLGRDRDDEEITEFAGGNAGCPFFIQWANDAPATGKRKSPGELRVGKKMYERSGRVRHLTPEPYITESLGVPPDSGTGQHHTTV